MPLDFRPENFSPEHELNIPKNSFFFLYKRFDNSGNGIKFVYKLLIIVFYK